MALRGDFQGGSAGGADRFGVGGDANIGVDKYLKWSIAFFVGAVLTTLTAVCTIIYWLQHFTFAPATMFFEFFLLIFGLTMCILDLPLPHLQNHPHAMGFRSKVYKFALFLTRFLGRGVWYLFLATLVFGALCDTGINYVLGNLCTLYLIGLGLASVAKGVLMTHKLNRVREAINGSGMQVTRFLGAGQSGLSKAQFLRMVKEVTQDEGVFTEHEMDYIANALSFTPYHDGEIKVEELQYWLGPGPALVV